MYQNPSGLKCCKHWLEADKNCRRDIIKILTMCHDIQIKFRANIE